MRIDVVVIGGGAVGAAVAYFLKFLDPSTQVSVVERDPTYSQASTPRGSGGVRRLFSLPENIELSKFSIAFFDTFAETMALDGVKPDIGLKKHGYLFIVPPSARDVLKRNFDTQQQLGCNVVWLEPYNVTPQLLLSIEVALQHIACRRWDDEEIAMLFEADVGLHAIQRHCLCEGVEKRNAEF